MQLIEETSTVLRFTGRDCLDLTLLIIPATDSGFPDVQGGFGDVRRGLLNGGMRIAIKSLKNYNGGDRQEILEVSLMDSA